MYMFKSEQRRAYFEHNIQPLIFKSKDDLHLESVKCFIPSCDELRVDAGEPINGWCGNNLCSDCLESGLSIWFCTEHSIHKESAENRSHESLISKYLSVSEFLRVNEQVCSEIEVFTEGELAEVVCICFEEGWSSLDLMGSNFFPSQNRQRLKCHFEMKYNLNVDNYRPGLRHSFL